MDAAHTQRRRFVPRRSLFWTVAGTLVGVQVTTSILAVALSARFAEERSLGLVAGSLRLRLDALAEEVEFRGAPLTEGLQDLPQPLLTDLATRLPDPIILLDPAGAPIRVILPEGMEEENVPAVTIPPDVGALLQTGDIVLNLPLREEAQSWGLVPVYDPDGFLRGGLLVKPMAGSISRELAPTYSAYRRAMVIVTLISIALALVLGGIFTWRLVRPIRKITEQVERIGAGEYSARVESDSRDELGRLALAVNQMAEAVEHSIETLKETDALRRELIANVGHDLRTPLAAMLGYVEESVHQLDAGREREARDALVTARRQGEFLTRLVGDLFELSLLDSASPPLHSEPVPVAELLSQVASSHRAEFERAGITFQLDLPPALPLIEADGVRLLRALDNLLANARQNTPSGGQVTLSAFVADDQVVVVVSDTGYGMQADELERVFDRYYRGRDARTRRTEGTGLGLPIARAVARAHGGDLVAESTPGKGSRFTLVLPITPHLPADGVPGDEKSLPDSYRQA